MTDKIESTHVTFSKLISFRKYDGFQQNLEKYCMLRFTCETRLKTKYLVAFQQASFWTSINI